MWENLMSREVIRYKNFYLKYKLLRCETKVYTRRKRDRERFYMVNFYLGKWLWTMQYRFAGYAYLSIVVYSVFGFSRWQQSATIGLIYTKPKGRCTFVVSVASLLSGAEKKLWRITHFHDQADRQPLSFLAFTMLHPLRAFKPNFTNY